MDLENLAVRGDRNVSTTLEPLNFLYLLHSSVRDLLALWINEYSIMNAVVIDILSIRPVFAFECPHGLLILNQMTYRLTQGNWSAASLRS